MSIFDKVSFDTLTLAAKESYRPADRLPLDLPLALFPRLDFVNQLAIDGFDTNLIHPQIYADAKGNYIISFRGTDVTSQDDLNSNKVIFKGAEISQSAKDAFDYSKNAIDLIRAVD